MVVILKPVFPEGVEEIPVHGGLLLIGQKEPPFASYEPSLAESLSLRHARIFADNNALFVVDLGSRGGTTLNGTTVGQEPRAINAGDEICFSGKLSYVIEISDAAAEATGNKEPEQTLRLLLVPEKTDRGLEPIAITRFPFMVSKAQGLFSTYKKRFPREINFISRRHAHIFLQSGQVYVEDLGSTNGTFIDGVRLDQQAILLKDGASLSFGQTLFIYKAELQDTAANNQHTVLEGVAAGKAAVAPSVPQGTTFISTAGSFLDIYCASNEDAQTEDEPGVRHPDVDRRSQDKLSLWLAQTPVGPMWSTLSARQQIGAQVIAGILLLVIAATVIGIFSDDSRQEIENLIAKGETVEALAEARAYLDENPGDEAVKTLAGEALTRHAVPLWIAAVGKRQFNEARQILSTAANSAPQPVATDLIELLGWATDIQQYAAEHEGQDTITIFDDEKEIKTLLGWWNRGSDEHMRLLDRITDQVADFANIRSRVLSQLRGLKSDQAVYVAAIDALKQTINEKLESGRSKELRSTLNEFQADYPRINGIQVLQTDLDKYLELERHIADRDLQATEKLLKNIEFKSPLFRDRLTQLTAANADLNKVAARYRQAVNAWQAGKHDQAINILKTLTDGVWGASAEARLTRYQDLLAKFKALSAASGSEDYPHQLIALYASLDPVEDKLMQSALKEEFDDHKVQALEAAEKSAQLARQHWQEYSEGHGGIGGALRLESRLSNTYRQQADRLSLAYEHINRSASVFSLLKVDVPPDMASLHADIVREVQRQRASLEDLRIVLDDSMVKAKLDLLPRHQESTQ